MESEAVLLVLRQFDVGAWTHVSSNMAVAEILAGSDTERRNRMLEMLPPSSAIMEITEAVLRRAEAIEQLGIRPADAVHVAVAEAQRADVLLTCDDKLLRAARRHSRMLRVRVCDPLTWMSEHEKDPNA